MSLSYYYEFTASANVTADELEIFLRDVELDAVITRSHPVVSSQSS